MPDNEVPIPEIRILDHVDGIPFRLSMHVRGQNPKPTRKEICDAAFKYGVNKSLLIHCALSPNLHKQVVTEIEKFHQILDRLGI